MSLSYWHKRLVQTQKGPRVLGARGKLHLPPIRGGDDTALATAVKEIKDHFQTAQSDFKKLLEQQEEEIKKLGTTSDSTVEQIKASEKRLEEIAEELKKVQEQATELETKLGRLDNRGTGERKSLGAQFVESEAYKNFVASEPSGTSHPYKVKALITGASLGDTSGFLFGPERVPGFFQLPDREQRVRDLFPVVRTSTGAVEFVRETGFTNAAATVADTGLAEKPESSITFEIVSTSVRTIAHHLPATRQIISDAPALEDYIDNRLITGLKLTEDEQLLFGSGMNSNLLGVYNTPNIQQFSTSDAQAAATQAGQDPDKVTKIDTVRRAINRARVAEFAVTGIAMHPDDWTDIELTKGDDGHYIWVSINDGGQMRFWRVPVVETTALEPGQALTGAFAQGGTIWDREDAQIRVTDSHSDDFTHNIWRILAEERLVLTIYRPEAFVEIDFEHPS